LENTKTIRKNSLGRRIIKARNAYFFILPLIVGLLIFCYYPPIYGLILSLYEKGASTKAVFVGFRNYGNLFNDKEFFESVPTMFKLMIPRLIIGIAVPFIIAEMIFAVRSKKTQGVLRVLLLLPIVAPGVVGLLLWRNIYDPSNGLFTSVLRGLGIMGKDSLIDWLNDPKWVIFSIIFMGFPWIGGTSVLIYMSGMMNISTEVIESTRLDGAGTLRRIFSIDIPLLLGQIRYFLIFGIIGGLQDYGTQIVVTQGGPGDATYVPGYYMFLQATEFDRLGYASAIGTVIFLVIMGLTAVCFRFIKTKGLEKF